MIDIHTHILPGVDDGVKTTEEAMAFAKMALADGVKTVFATPHSMTDGAYRNLKDDIVPQVEALNEALRLHEIDLDVIPGSEIFATWDLAERISNGEFLTLGNMGRYVLFELSTREAPRFMEALIFELQTIGVTPILAHPERYQWLSDHQDQLRDWVERGMLCQVNAPSLLYPPKSRTRQTAQRYIEMGCVHFLASDAHNTGRRPPMLGRVRHIAEALFGEEAAKILLETNPAAVLHGDSVSQVTPVPRSSRVSGGVWRKLTRIFGK